MATRNNRLIFPSFFGSKESLENPLSSVNSSARLQPGELIFELETSKFKTNLTNITASYTDLGYTGDIITLSGSLQITSYKYPYNYQLIIDTATDKFYRYESGSTYIPSAGDLISGDGNKVYKYQGELITVSSSIFNNLPTSDPRVTGRLFTTQSDAGNLTGQKVVLVSQG
jgi:hypothetical protein